MSDWRGRIQNGDNIIDDNIIDSTQSYAGIKVNSGELDVGPTASVCVRCGERRRAAREQRTLTFRAVVEDGKLRVVEAALVPDGRYELARVSSDDHQHIWHRDGISGRWACTVCWDDGGEGFDPPSRSDHIGPRDERDAG